MEKEVFVECGAWKNFVELEEELTLEELAELYDATVEKQNRIIKVLGMAQGLEFEESSDVSYQKGQDDWKKPPSEKYFITGEDDLVDFPYGLGYEVAAPQD